MAISAWIFIGWYWWAGEPTADVHLYRYLLLVPVALIWFCEPLGDAAGIYVFRWTEFLGASVVRQDLVDTALVAIAISLFAWTALLSPLWVFYLLRITTTL